MTRRVAVDLLSYTGTKGGMETYARELYRTLGEQATSFEFVGLASREGYELGTDWFPGEVIDTGISGERRVEWARGEVWGIARWAERVSADLLHCPATLGPRKTSMPTVVTMHDMLYWSHPELMSTPVYTRPVRWIERQASRNARRILTDSAVSKSEIVKYLGKDDDLVHVVPLAGTAGPMSGVERSPGPEPMILATGNRRPHKNWGALIRALALVAPELRPKLVITGSRGDDPLRPIVDELALHDWVDLRAWQSDEQLGELYRRASIMAMPSFCDGFCLPALEAMMVRMPVMLSDIPVYREVAGDAALYFDPRDDASIARAIEVVATDPTRLEQLAAAGSENVKRFSWERVARETLEVFDLALEEAVATR